MAADMSHGPHRGRVYAVWDETVHYQDAPFQATTAAIDNATNAAYMEALGYPALGRAVRAGLRVAF